jgi:hypothetical protein
MTRLIGNMGTVVSFPSHFATEQVELLWHSTTTLPQRGLKQHFLISNVPARYMLPKSCRSGESALEYVDNLGTE